MNDFIKYKDFFSPASNEKPAFDEISAEKNEYGTTIVVYSTEIGTITEIGAVESEPLYYDIRIRYNPEDEFLECFSQDSDEENRDMAYCKSRDELVPVPKDFASQIKWCAVEHFRTELAKCSETIKYYDIWEIDKSAASASYTNYNSKSENGVMCSVQIATAENKYGSFPVVYPIRFQHNADKGLQYINETEPYAFIEYSMAGTKPISIPKDIAEIAAVYIKERLEKSFRNKHTEIERN